MSGDHNCCYCHVFGTRFIIQQSARSSRGKAWTCPVPELTQDTVRRIGYAFCCLGILATLGLFTAMVVSQYLKYPGPSWCAIWQTHCDYQVVQSGGISVMNSFDKAYVATMLGTLILNILGLIGVGRQKRSILCVVGVLLSLCFVAQVTLSGFHGSMLGDRLLSVVPYPHEAFYQGQVSMYGNLKSISPNHDTWDHLQRDNRCCGVLSHKDWQEYHSYIPKSCTCDKERRRNYDAPCATVNLKSNFTNSVYNRGCLKQVFSNASWRYINWERQLWKAGLGLAFFQWFPMIFALVFGFHKKSGGVADKGEAPPVCDVVLNKQPAVQ